MKNEDIYIRLLKYGNRYPQGFNFNQIINDKKLNLNHWEKEIVKKGEEYISFNFKEY